MKARLEALVAIEDDRMLAKEASRKATARLEWATRTVFSTFLPDIARAVIERVVLFLTQATSSFLRRSSFGCHVAAGSFSFSVGLVSKAVVICHTHTDDLLSLAGRAGLS